MATPLPSQSGHAPIIGAALTIIIDGSDEGRGVIFMLTPAIACPARLTLNAMSSVKTRK